MSTAHSIVLEVHCMIEEPARIPLLKRGAVYAARDECMRISPYFCKAGQHAGLKPKIFPYCAINKAFASKKYTLLPNLTTPLVPQVLAHLKVVCKHCILGCFWQHNVKLF